MKKDKRWKKRILTNEFVSESCAIIGYDDNLQPIILAGEYLWFVDGKKIRIREIEDAWLPAWPYKDRIDVHASLRKTGGPPQYKADTYDFVDDLNHDGHCDIITVGMHTDPIYWFENPGEKNKTLWKKHLITEGGVYESVCYADLFNTGKRQLVTVPKKPFIAWYEPQENPYEKWREHIVSPIGGDWHGLGVLDINNDGKMEIITQNHIFVVGSNIYSEWDIYDVIVIEEEKQVNGFGDCFQFVMESVGNTSYLFSTSPHAFGLFCWELIDIDSKRYVFKKHIIDTQVSQLHNIKNFLCENEKVIITGKRYFAHGPTGDIDSNGKAYLLEYVINCNQAELYSIDDNSGAGINFAIDKKGSNIYISTSNKKGVFLFERKT